MKILQTRLAKKKIYLSILSLLVSSSLAAQTVGSFLDVRDQQTYEIVTYEIPSPEQLITDHDEYGTYLNGEPQTHEVTVNNGLPESMTWMTENLNFQMEESKCKYETDSDCRLHGRLYTWEAATNACPAGWHLPSDDEWYVLAYLYDGVSAAGEHLKSTNAKSLPSCTP